jgi:hypothetical protein
MKTAHKRFHCVQDSSCAWTVIDSKTGEPAILDGLALVDRQKPQAEAARRVLENIDEERENGSISASLSN